MPQPLIAAQDVLKDERRTYPTLLLIGSLSDSGLSERICRSLSQAHIPAWALYPDDEEALNTGESSLDHTVYYDRLALLCTDAGLENPLASRFFSELVRSAKQGRQANLIALGAVKRSISVRTVLCKELRESLTIDIRGWEDAFTLESAVAHLVRELSAPVF